MRERGIEYRVGLLVISAVLLFGGFIFALGNFSLEPGYTLYVDYDFSGNVHPGAPVKVSGIKVGRVENVEFLGGKVDPITKRRVQVRVQLWIEERARHTIRQDAEFFINTAGVLGEQYVEIVPGSNWDAPFLAPGSIVEGVNPPRTDLIVSRLYEVLDAVSIVLRRDRDKIQQLITGGANAVDEVNGMLVENRPRIGKLIVSMTELADEADTTLEKVNGGLDSRMIARVVSNTDQLLVTTNETLDGVAPHAEAFLQDATRVTGLVTEDRIERTVGAIDRISGTAQDARTLLSTANGLLVDVRSGKGTVGSLLARDEIYADVREMVRDLKRNPWKLVWKE